MSIGHIRRLDSDSDQAMANSESGSDQAASGDGGAGGDKNDGDESDGSGSDGEVSGAEALGGDADTSGVQTPVLLETRSEHEARHRTLEEQKNCSRCAYYAWAKTMACCSPLAFAPKAR